MNRIKKIINNKRGIATTTSFLLIVSLIMISISDKNASSANTKIDKDVKNMEKDIDNAYPKVLKSNGNSKDKIETTYVIMDADGKHLNTIVTEKLSNNANEKELNDLSNLENIENTSGNETFTKNADNIKWKADGNKIEYKGNTEEKLPVKVHVSYYLNGEQKTAEEIAGSCGNVKIRFDYEILHKNLVNGRVYDHPYTMISGVILNDDNFSDVNVTNGKAVDDGNKTVALGIAFPSMRENLGIKDLNLLIPSYIEVSAYTDNFNILGTYSVALSDMFNDIDSDYSGEIDSKIKTLKESLNKLSDSSKQLLMGTKELYNGEYKLDNGIKNLSNGTSALNKGFSEALTGAGALNDGLQNLSKNSKKINDGMNMLESSLFDDATNQMREKLKDNEIILTPENYIQTIQGISDKAVKVAEKNLRNELKSKGVTNLELQNQILSAAYNRLMAENKSEASIDEIKTAIKASCEIAKHAQYVKNAVEKNGEIAIGILTSKGYSNEEMTEELIAVTSTSLELANGDVTAIDSKTSEAVLYVKDAQIFSNAKTNSVENVKKLSSIAVGKETPQKLAYLKNNLDRFESLKAGIMEYTNGVNAAATGSSKLLIGLNELDCGIRKLDEASSELSRGSDSLRNGLNKLSESMNRFDKEGISKFTESLNKSDIIEISNNIKGIKEASKHQIFMGGKLDSMSGESRIIFKTDEIK